MCPTFVSDAEDNLDYSCQDEPTNNSTNEVVQPATVDSDNENETGVDDDEEVTICVDNVGNVTALADQIADYTQCPRELHGMSLWDFVARMEKVYCKKSAADKENVNS